VCAKLAFNQLLSAHLHIESLQIIINNNSLPKMFGQQIRFDYNKQVLGNSR